MPAQTRMQRRDSSLIRDRICVLLLLAAAAFRPLLAAEPEVPYVPTPQVVVDRMLEMAKIGPQDYLIDLGSGDGRIVITAARKYGVRGFGVDIDPERIEESNDNARRAGVADRVAFYRRDLFETDLADATVITMYLLPQVNLALRPRLLALKPGTRIVSHDFSMDPWQPDEHVAMDAAARLDGSGGTSDIYLWRVPARVAGRWAWDFEVSGQQRRYEIQLDQRFQVLSGTARVDGQAARIDRARLDGANLHLEFTVAVNGSRVKHVLDGTVDGDAVSGGALLAGDRIRSQRDWVARRTAGSASLTDVFEPTGYALRRQPMH